MSKRHRVVIVGGGFAGLYAAKRLGRAPVDVTLIDRRNFHLFQPLLYQVATGTLSPGEIAYPLRAILKKNKNTRVLLGEAVDLDPVARKVILTDAEVPYDSLIVATGARNHYFGNSTWEKVAPGLKSIEDATRIRHRILRAFECAEREPDPEKRRAWLTFVIVGAGPTGVELAGALAEIAKDVLRDNFRTFRPEESRILLLDGSERVLPPFAPELSAAAERSLIKLGVRPRPNVRVTAIEPGRITLTGPNGVEHIDTHTVLWAAGVTISKFGERLAERCGVPRERSGKLLVDADCTVPDYPEIFVTGDLASLKNARGEPLPGDCPTAMQEGEYAAKAILARLEGRDIGPFRQRDKGSLAVIGRLAGVARLGSFKFSGYLAWLLWLFVHLMYLVGFQNRLVVFVRWGFAYLTYNRGARLITGDTDPKV